VSGRTRPSPDQLALALDDVLGQPEVPGPAALIEWATPMLPGDGAAPFDDSGWFFEPWWPGVPATIVIERGVVALVAGQMTDPLPAFPELRDVAAQVRATVAVITGTLLVLDIDGRPDAGGLRRRLADADDRVGTGAFIAADLLARDGVAMVDLSFAERRAGLLEVVRDGDRFLASRGLHGEGGTLAAAAASMGIDGISARRLDAPWYAGVAPYAWLRSPVVDTTVGPVRPLLVLLQRLPLD
jgi:bifunctional non-homologous end joining protein LigD